MNRPDWKEGADDDGYEDGSFIVLGRVGETENIIDEADAIANAVEGTEIPSPVELQPEEVRKIMEAPMSPPSSVLAVLSKVAIAESLTPSFVSGDNASLTTAGSSLSSSSTEAIFDNATNQVAHFTEENQILRARLEATTEKMKNNLEMFEKFEASVSIRLENNKQKHEESRQLISSLRAKNEILKSKLSVEEQSCRASVQQQASEIGFVDLKDLEQQILAKDGSLKRMHTLLEENVTLLKEEKHQTDILKNLLREHEMTKLCAASVNDEWKLEKEHYEMMLETLKKEIESGRSTISKFSDWRVKMDNEIVALKKELGEANEKVEHLKAGKCNQEKEIETLRTSLENTRIIAASLENHLEAVQKDKILLATTVAAIKAENEDTEHLKEQIEVYRLDYLAEREGRSKLDEERASLLQELANAKDLLKKKEEELEVLHKTHLNFATEHVNRAESFSSLNERNSMSPTPTSSQSMNLGNKFFGFIRNEVLGLRNDDAANADAPSASTSEPGMVISVDQGTPTLRESKIQPCPVCCKSFDNLSKLQKHAAICGLESEEFQDPFVFP